MLNEIISIPTGQPVEKLKEDTERYIWFSAKEALAYGIIDKIIGGDLCF